MTTPAKSLAEAHVDWQLTILRPLLISYFEHGFKHGVDHEKNRVKDYQKACSIIAKKLVTEEDL